MSARPKIESARTLRTARYRDKHRYLHHNHHQRQYHRHVVAPAKSLDARKHGPPVVSSISSSVSGSLRSRSPSRWSLKPRSVFLSFLRSSFFLLRTNLLFTASPCFVALLPLTSSFRTTLSFFVPFHHFLLSRSSYLALFSSSSFSMRCFFFTSTYATLPPPCLCYHVLSFLRLFLLYSRSRFGEFRPVRAA